MRQISYYYAAWAILFSALAFKHTEEESRYRLYKRVFSDQVCGREITRPKTIVVFYLLIYIPIFTLEFLHYYTDAVFSVLFKEDGVFETLTALIFIASSLVFFYASYKSRIASQGRIFSAKGVLFPLNFATAMLFFGIGMEEISWGQRLLDLPTPATLGAINYQAELNLHNLFNPYRVAINRTVASTALLILLLGRFRENDADSWFFDWYFPHSCLLLLALPLILVGGILDNEMFEELVSVFVGFYSYRAYRLYSTVTLLSNTASADAHSRRPAG